MKRWLGLAAFAAPAPGAAHGTEHGLGWTLEPVLIVPLALVLLVYLLGLARLWARSGEGRRERRREAVLFLAGWVTLALALVSPLHEAGERSFTLHMVEHELIMLPAALLLAAASAGGTLMWGLPRALRPGVGSLTRAVSPVWRALTEPVTATLIQAVTMIGWHLPAVFDRALDSTAWHIAQHASFLAAGLIFWSAMLHSRRPLLAAGCLFVTSMIGGALGALMSFSTSPWYHGYAVMGLSGLGLDPVTDQRLAGLLMWIPGGAVHALAALVLVHRWLKQGGGRDGALARG